MTTSKTETTPKSSWSKSLRELWYYNSSFLRQLKDYYIHDKLPNLLGNSKEYTHGFNNYYVNLEVVKEDEHQKAINSLKNSQEIEEVYQSKLLSGGAVGIEHLYKDKESGWTLITGRPGTGKTTLLQYVAYCWGKQEVAWYEHFDLVFRVKLQLLADEKFSFTDDVDNLAKAIYLSFDNKSQNSPAKPAKEAIAAYLKKDNSRYRCLLLLDGFDEIHSLYKEGKSVRYQEVVNFIDFAMQNFPRGIMTARPNTIPLEWIVEGAEKRFTKERRFENMGLTTKNVHQYINSFFNTSTEQALAENLLSELSANPRMMSLAQIPVNIVAFCVIWKDRQKKTEAKETVTPINTMTELYYQLLEKLLRRYSKQFPRESHTPIMPNNQSTECGQRPKLFTTYQKELSFLSALAYKAFNLETPTQEFDDTLLKETVLENGLKEDILRQITDEFGLLRASGKDIENEDSSVRYASRFFIHLTYQEFFTAFYMAELFSKPESTCKATEIVRREKIQEIARFIKDKRDNSQYVIVWTFLAGLVSRPEYSAGADYFWDALLFEFSETPLQTRANTIGLHPHMKTLCSKQRICQEALLTTASYNQELSTHLTYLHPYLNALLTWQNVQQTEDLMRTRDKDSKNTNRSLKKQHQTNKVSSRVTSSARFSFMPVLKQIPNFLNKIQQIENPDSLRQLLATDYCNNRDLIIYLGIRDTKIIQALKALLLDSSNTVQQAAAEIVGYLDIKDAEIIQSLKTLSQDEEDPRYEVDPRFMVRLQAAESLWRLGIEDNETMQTLNDLMDEQDRRPKLLAIAAFGRLGIQNVEMLQILRKLSKDQDFHIRCQVLGTLGYFIHNKEGFQICKNMSKDTNIYVRRSVVSALANIDTHTPDTLQLLQLMLNDTEWYVQYAAAEALGRLGVHDEKTLQTLKIMMKSTNPDYKHSSTNILIGLGDPETLKMITAQLTDSEWAFRMDAVNALTYLSRIDSEVYRALSVLLKDPEWDVRKVTAQALERFGIQNREICLILLQATQVETDIKIVYEAYMALLRADPDLLLIKTFVTAPIAQYLFVISTWLHASSLFFNNGQFILDRRTIITPEDTNNFQNELNLFQALQAQQEKFLTALGLPEKTMSLLREPIQLPTKTPVFDEDFTTRDLPEPQIDKTEIRFQAIEIKQEILGMKQEESAVKQAQTDMKVIAHSNILAETTDRVETLESQPTATTNQHERTINTLHAPGLLGVFASMATTMNDTQSSPAQESTCGK